MVHQWGRLIGAEVVARFYQMAFRMNSNVSLTLLGAAEQAIRSGTLIEGQDVCAAIGSVDRSQ